MSEVFLKMIDDFVNKSSNMSRCIGILNAVISSYESLLETTPENNKRIEYLKKSKKVADYLWENRSKELPSNYDELYNLAETEIADSETTLSPVL